jgi:hypothetical protein
MFLPIPGIVLVSSRFVSDFGAPKWPLFPQGGLVFATAIPLSPYPEPFGDWSKIGGPFRINCTLVTYAM